MSEAYKLSSEEYLTSAGVRLEPKKKIYVLEDDFDLQAILKHQLARKDYDVICFDRAEEIFDKIEGQQANLPDCFIVDINLAGNMNGLDFTRILRERKDTASVPVLMLTAKGENSDIVSGLQEGADDYLPKPFEMEVFMARVDSLLRRVQKNAGKVSLLKSKISLAGIDMDPVSRQVVAEGKLLDLTFSEFGILFCIMSRPNAVFDRDELLLRVMGRSRSLTSRTIDVHVRALRKKLGDLQSHIHTVRGIGYKFVP